MGPLSDRFPTVPPRWRSAVHVTAFVLLLAATLLALMRVAAPHYPHSWLPREKLRTALAQPRELRSVVLGNSHALGIQPRVTGEPGINLAHAGADLFEIAYLMRWAQAALPELSVVLVSVSPFSFGYDNATYLSHGANPRADIRRQMYAMLPSWRPLRGDGALLLQGKLFSLVTSDHWQSVLWPGSRGGEATSAPEPQAEEGAGEEANLSEHARRRCAQLEANLRIMEKQHPEVEADAARALREASQQLQRAGVQVVFVVTPLHRSFLDNFDRARLARMRRQLLTLAASPHLPVLDDSESPRFVDDDAMFSNSDHLSVRGLELYNLLLADALREALHRTQAPGSSGD